MIDDARMSPTHTHMYERTDGQMDVILAPIPAGYATGSRTSTSAGVDTVEGKAQQAGSHTRRALLTYFKLSILFSALRSPSSLSLSFLSRGLLAYIACVVLDLKIIIQSDAMSIAV